jgi:hypothetical protein
MPTHGKTFLSVVCDPIINKKKFRFVVIKLLSKTIVLKLFIENVVGFDKSSSHLDIFKLPSKSI